MKSKNNITKINTIDEFIEERHNEYLTWLDSKGYTDKHRTRRLFVAQHPEFSTYLDFVADLQTEFDLEEML